MIFGGSFFSTFLTITGGTMGVGIAIGVGGLITGGTGFTIFFGGLIIAILMTFGGSAFNFFSIFPNERKAK